MATEKLTAFQEDERVFWVRIARIECSDKSPWEYMKRHFLKVANVLYPPRLKFPRFTSNFQKTSADYDDKVENCPLFRKQN